MNWVSNGFQEKQQGGLMAAMFGDSRFKGLDITNREDDSDIIGSEFGKLRLFVKKTARTSQKLKWNKISGATKYFIYGKLRPYLNKYWYNDSEQPEEIICSSEFFVFDIKDNINTNYFKYVLASYIVQKQIVDAMSGARMPRISEDTFRNIQIPLPPLDIQNEIVEHITLLREKQKTMIEQAKERRKQAAQQFEQTIFN